MPSLSCTPCSNPEYCTPSRAQFEGERGREGKRGRKGEREGGGERERERGRGSDEAVVGGDDAGSRARGAEDQAHLPEHGPRRDDSHLLRVETA
eukprot:3643980-Rhodomonas_salina.2